MVTMPGRSVVENLSEVEMEIEMEEYISRSMNGVPVTIVEEQRREESQGATSGTTTFTILDWNVVFKSLTLAYGSWILNQDQEAAALEYVV